MQYYHACLCFINTALFYASRNNPRFIYHWRFPDICTLQREGGPCLGYYPSWYFDPTDGTCKQFIYGGCAGNANRFAERGECEKVCETNDRLDLQVYGLGKQCRD